MVIKSLPTTKGWTERLVGNVYASIKLANAADTDRVASSELAEKDVRSISIPEILVDTGATLLGLPAEMVAFLGLRELRTTVVETAFRTGLTPRRAIE